MTRSLDGVPRGLSLYPAMACYGLLKRTECYYLHEIAQHVTMRVALKDAEGGRFDCYGLSYSRGGSNRTQTLRGYGQEITPLSQNARVQTWGGMANRQNRVRGVETPEQKSIPTSRGQITLVSVAHRMSTSFQPINIRRCVCYLVAYFTLFGNTKQHQTTLNNGNGWLEGQEEKMRTRGNGL